MKASLARAQHGSRSPRTPRSRVRPCIERLEDRCLLDSGLTQFGSPAALTQYLVNTALDQYKGLFGNAFPTFQFIPYGGGGPALPAGFTGALGGAGGLAPAQQPAFSQTNVQVTGVDEGDLAKTDGTYIYDFSRQNLVIVKAVPSASMSVVSTTPIEGTPDVLYLIGNRVLVISSIFANVPLPAANQGPPTFPLLYNSTSKIKLTLLDVSDTAKPQTVRSEYMDGFYLTSRAIGNQVYVADQNFFSGLPAPAYTSFNGEIIYETKDQYLARISGHEIDLALPHYFTGSNAANLQSGGFLTDPALVYRPSANNNNNLISLFSFDVTSNTTTAPEAVSVFGYFNSVVYASPSHIYVVSPNWSTQAGQVDQGSNVFQFSANGAQITLTSSGAVPGQVLSQFWLDEQGDDLRIATTTNWNANSINKVYDLRNNGGTLQTISQTDNLAPGEQIRSVLFVGPTAYVSTSRVFDPLFVVDLSVPTTLRVLGFLTMPGSTTYLQALDATHLLGLGRVDSFPSILQVTLFDVSNPTAPKVVDQTSVTPSLPNWFWSGSEAEFEHRAVGYFSDFQTLALPIYGTSFVDAGGVHFQSDLSVIKVNFTKGFQFLGQIHHDSQVRRSIVIGDQLYSIADDSIQAHPIANPQAQGSEVITAVDQIKAFLTNLYQNLLNRAPDATGMAAWTTLLNLGVSQAQIATDIEGSLECRTDRVQNLYSTLLGRSADATGLKDFVSFLGAGGTIAQVKAALLGSDEYFKHSGGSDSGFLAGLYHDVLGRDIDTTGAAAWASQLANHVSRASVAAAVLASSEAQVDQVQSIYESALHRGVDNAGLAFFTGILQQGGAGEAVLASVCGSDEYFNRMQ